MRVLYSVDRKEKLFPADKHRDSVLRCKREIELHFAEGIEGTYRMLINDSVFFEGKLSSDPKIGFEPRIFIVTIKEGENILSLQNLDDSRKAAIKIESRYSYLIVRQKNYCTILAKSSNARPFRG